MTEEKLLFYKQKKDESIERTRQEIEKKQMAECYFHPATNNRSTQMLEKPNLLSKSWGQNTGRTARSWSANKRNGAAMKCSDLY
jgi:hypothetical protein